ncbi:hypothetical protein ANN_24484 [Periplaneta americana]|uniref:Uncharacterized protein n=1 Tax=Periplaneta americana TaxID=6978 RepID=A0ABQ8S3I5_PERAM|nr:hypothetical protein ANN_24484 [Periplaneta americana]
MYGARKKVWKMLRNRKAEISERVEVSDIGINTWENYFQQLYNENMGQTQEIQINMNIIDNGDDMEEITAEDINEAMKTLKNKKAPGQDEISNEILKSGGKRIREQMKVLFNKILELREISQEWKTDFQKGKEK